MFKKKQKEVFQESCEVVIEPTECVYCEKGTEIYAMSFSKLPDGANVQRKIPIVYCPKCGRKL